MIQFRYTIALRIFVREGASDGSCALTLPLLACAFAE